MHNISKVVPDVKVKGRQITSCPVDFGELSLCANWDLLSARAVHSSYIILENDINRNRNRNDVMMLPCLTPTLKLMAVSVLPMMR